MLLWILIGLFALVAVTVLAKHLIRRPLVGADAPVVFTLSTIPTRLPFVKPVLEGLLNSSLKPRAVYLNLPTRSLREGKAYTIPEELEELARKDPRLVLNWCGTDHGPATKLYPTLLLERDPDTILILADDDELYPERYHEELVDELVRNPGSAVAYRGFNMTDDGRMKWITRGGLPEVLEAYTGVAFRRESFGDDFVPFTIDSPCFFTDDIAFSHHLVSRGVQLRTIDGLPMGSRRGLGNRRHPVQPRNHVAATNPLSASNMGTGGDRNVRCYNMLYRSGMSEKKPKEV